MKIAMVSLSGFYRAPLAAELLSTVAKYQGLSRNLRCEPFAILDTIVGRYNDISTIMLLNHREKILHKGNPIQLFKPETIDTYDYILATDRKSWSLLDQMAPPNTTTRIELFGQYNPYEKLLDFPDVFFEYGRSDGGRRLRWALNVFRTAANIFIQTHYDNIKSRRGMFGCSPTSYSAHAQTFKPYNDSMSLDYLYSWNLTNIEEKEN